MPASLVGAVHAAAVPDISIGHLLLQMVVALVLVVGCIWVFGKLMRRSRVAGRRVGGAAGAFFRQRREEQGLTILSRQPVGKGKCIAVVQVGTQQFLVGIADSGLTPLGELHADAEGGDRLEAGTAPALPTALGGSAGDFTSSGGTRAAAGSVDLRALGVGTLDLRSTPRHAPARPAAVAPGQPGTVRSLVDALREATVRR